MVSEFVSLACHLEKEVVSEVSGVWKLKRKQSDRERQSIVAWPHCSIGDPLHGAQSFTAP